jgi:DNA-binding NtrC family response regulator
MARYIPRIMLVEPDGVLAEVTAFRLELLGYHVETVTSVEEAQRAVAAKVPDLIITDLNLNGVSATGLIESLTSDETTNGIPVMVMSIDGDLDRVTAVHKVGAIDFLVVPYQPEVLQEKVSRLLSQFSRRESDREKSKVAAG